jgi:hypothetical protein
MLVLHGGMLVAWTKPAPSYLTLLILIILFRSFSQCVVSGGRNALLHVAVKILIWCHQTHDTFMRSMHAITEPTNHRMMSGTGK